MSEEKTFNTITDVLNRMSELERENISTEAKEKEFDELTKQIDNIVQKTEFNGVNLLNEDQTISIDISVEIGYAIEDDTLFIFLPESAHILIESELQKGFTVELDDNLEEKEKPVNLDIKDGNVKLTLAPSLINTIKNVQFNFQEE